MRIVSGNDFLLKIPFTKYQTRGGVTAKGIFHIEEASDVKVSLTYLDLPPERVMLGVSNIHPLKSLERFRHKQELTITGKEEGTLYARVSSDLPICHRYDLEVTGIYDGKQFRTNERNVLEIVSSNDEANISPTIYEGEDSYNIDTQLVFMPDYPLEVVTEEEYLSLLDNGKIGEDILYAVVDETELEREF